MAISGDVFFSTISELSAKLRAKEFSAVELTRAFCDRLETIGARHNALALSLRKEALRKARDVDGDLKRERTRGPLQGIPYGAKDLLAVKKHPTTWGSRVFAGQVFDDSDSHRIWARFTGTERGDFTHPLNRVKSRAMRRGRRAVDLPAIVW